METPLSLMHCSAMASLWEPGFALASVLLAYLLLRWWHGDRSLWKAILVSALATPFAHVIAERVETG